MSLQVVVNFRVIDESDDWIVVDKPAPLIVHPANRKPEPTLLGGIEHLLAYEIENGACPAIVNRLDRDTSGVVLVAKHTAAARELGMIFERREAEKEYLAIVHRLAGSGRLGMRGADPPRRRARALGDLGAPDRASRRAGLPDAFSGGATLRAGGGEVFPGPLFSGNRPDAPDPRASGARRTSDRRRQTLFGRRLGIFANGWPPAGRRNCRTPVLPRHALHAASLEIAMERAADRWEADLARDLADFVAGQGNRRDSRSCHLESA